LADEGKRGIQMQQQYDLQECQQRAAKWERQMFESFAMMDHRRAQLNDAITAAEKARERFHKWNDRIVDIQAAGGQKRRGPIPLKPVPRIEKKSVRTKQSKSKRTTSNSLSTHRQGILDFL
jgi:hypothetical protein